METNQLITSKLMIPSSSQTILSRQRLLEWLDDLNRYALTLVTSPVGYGKTTLIRDWLATSTFSYSWYNLDATDNDESIFWRYLLQCLKKHHPGFGKLTEEVLSQKHASLGDDIVSAFLSDLNQFTSSRYRPSKLVIVLDNFHMLTAASLLNAFERFIDYLPAYIHLLLLSRDQPEINIAARLIRQEARELDKEALKFTRDETQAFLKSRLGGLDNDAVKEKLHQETNGWVALLQLACLSSEGNHATRGQSLRLKTTALFSQFLIEEVVSHWPQRELALYKSIARLPRFSAELVEAVLPLDDALFLNRKILSSSLFNTIPGKTDETWYAFHPLIKDWLIQHDQQSGMNQQDTLSLLRLSAHWHSAKGLKIDAVEIFQELGEYDQAALILGQETEALINRGQATTLSRIIEDFPPAIQAQYPKLQLCKAISLFRQNQFAEVKHVLSTVRNKLLAAKNSASSDYGKYGLANREEVDNCNRLVDLIHSFILRLQGDLDEAKAICLNLVKDNCAESFEMISWVYMGLATDHYRLGDINSAITCANKGLLLAKQSMDITPLTFCLSWLVHGLLENGKVNLAKQVFQDELQWLQLHLPPESRHFYRVYGAGTQVYRELNDLKRAWDCHHRAQQLETDAFADDLIYYKYMGKISLELAEGNYDEAVLCLDAMTLFYQSNYEGKWSFVIPQPAYIKGSIESVRGNAAAFKEILENPPAIKLYAAPFAYKTDQSIYLSFALLTGKDVLNALVDIQQWATDMGAVTLAIRIGLTKGAAAFLAGETEKAEEQLFDALRLARKGGYIQLLLGEGRRIIPALQLAIKKGVEPEYCHYLLSELTQRMSSPKTVSKTDKKVILEPLRNVNEITSRFGYSLLTGERT